MFFFKPDPKKDTIKELEKEKKQSSKFTNLIGELARCEDFFVNVIRTASVNADKRRQRRVSDKADRDQVREAVIGFLAVEELELDLPMLKNEQKLDQALSKLTKITLKMQLMAPGVPSIGLKDIYREMDSEQSIDLEASSLSTRANLVNDDFVNKLIKGVMGGGNIRELIHRLLEEYVENNSGETASDKPDFTQYEDTPVKNEDLLKQYEDLI